MLMVMIAVTALIIYELLVKRSFTSKFNTVRSANYYVHGVLTGLLVLYGIITDF